MSSVVPFCLGGSCNVQDLQLMLHLCVVRVMSLGYFSSGKSGADRAAWLAAMPAVGIGALCGEFYDVVKAF